MRKKGWFSHDVTRIQTTKLSILLRFYFHSVLKQLKTNFQTNFRFKRVLGFVIDTLEFLRFCVTRHLHDGRESCHLAREQALLFGQARPLSLAQIGELARRLAVI